MKVNVLFVVVALVALSFAIDANFTIHHSNPLVLYIPSHAWIPTSSSHQSIPDQFATLHLTFIGTAFYLYCFPEPTFLNVSFSLDGLPLPSYEQIPTDSLLLSLNGLSNTLHSLRVAVAPGSSFVFDHLIYTAEATPAFRIQPRQATTADSSTQSSPTSTGDPNQNNQTQIGAIAGAIAASIGITSLFSIGLAVSIIKIRRQRLRVRREVAAELERTRGLDLHLPPPSGRVPVRRPTPVLPTRTEVLDPPPMYNSVMRLNNRHSIVITHLPPIDEVSTIHSSQGSTRLTRRDPTPRDSSLDEVPDNPPGLSTLSDHLSQETIRASQDASRPPEHNHQE